MIEQHIKAEKDYVKGMKYKDIAAKYGVSINTVKSWHRRHGWVRNKGQPAPEPKSTPDNEGVHPKKVGAPKNNINAKGGKGGRAPEGNQNAFKHGLFAKYLPDETKELMEVVSTLTATDLLWEQIRIQFANIMRSQKIMYVSDKDDMTKEIKKTETYTGFGDEPDTSEKTEYEIQFAWDKQASLLNAQSRAMGELRSLIKQFVAIADENDIRKAQLGLINAQVDKIKADTKKDKIGGVAPVIIDNIPMPKGFEGDSNGG